MRCLDCKHCDLRSKPEMARHGFVRCKYVQSSSYPSARAERECKHFDAAAPSAVSERAKWLAAQHEFFKQQLTGRKSAW